jgi:hypothetical protein
MSEEPRPGANNWQIAGVWIPGQSLMKAGIEQPTLSRSSRMAAIMRVSDSVLQQGVVVLGVRYSLTIHFVVEGS